MDLELLLAKNNFTTDDKHFLEDFVRTDENNSLKFGANNEPDLTQFIDDLEGQINGLTSKKHFLEDFVRKEENNSLKFGANINEPDLTQFIEDLEGRIIGRQSEISIYCFYSILCLYIVVILIGSDVGSWVAKVGFGLGFGTVSQFNNAFQFTNQTTYVLLWFKYI